MHKKNCLTILLLLSISISQNANRKIINKVFFIGNKQIDSIELEEQIELKPPSILKFNSIDFDRRLLKLDAINIKNYYNSIGFLEASVKDSFDVNNNKVDIFFLINERKQYHLSDVRIEGLNSLDNKKIITNLGLFRGGTI